MAIDPFAALVGFVIVASVVGVIGVAIGILVIGPRLTRWAERDEEPGDGDDRTD